MAALDPARRAVVPAPGLADALAAAGRPVEVRHLAAVEDHAAEALVLGDDELSRAGDGAEGLLAEAARALRPGGALLVSVLSPTLPAARGVPLAGRRGFTSAELAQALGHRGFAVELVAAPGAGAHLGGAARGTRPVYDPVLDRMPGLLDCAERLVAVAAAPADERSRSRTFFATLPRKLVAAAVMARDPAGRLLVVFDSFRGHWTVPGGVVDADEDPAHGAAREAREEAGVEVATGDLLGVFSSAWPDRLLFVFAATPVDPDAVPAPIHTHEIDAAEWLTLDAALPRLNPWTRWQVERCLAEPGRVWRQ